MLATSPPLEDPGLANSVASTPDCVLVCVMLGERKSGIVTSGGIGCRVVLVVTASVGRVVVADDGAPGGVVPGGVVPGGMVPGGMVPGGVVSGGVLLGWVVLGEVVPGGVVGGVVAGGVVAGGMVAGGMVVGAVVVAGGVVVGGVVVGRVVSGKVVVAGVVVGGVVMSCGTKGGGGGDTFSLKIKWIRNTVIILGNHWIFVFFGTIHKSIRGTSLE